MTKFTTTRWSLILDARTGQASAREALEEICRAYRSPVLAYVRRSGTPRLDAEDLTQEFFTRLLERRWDEHADPARGRFRAFLLTALKRFLLDARDSASTQKRGGGQLRVEWEDATAALPGADASSPEHAFERAWAATVIERAYARLREEAMHAGKQALFERLSPFLAEAPDAADYPRIAAELGLRANTIAVSVHRLRLRLRELVRAEIADQTDGPDAVEAELKTLRNALRIDAPNHGGGDASR
ncbi:MAG: sigma-70 family RNA polymerase sigma factor [Luteimonas sp.]|nr:sigma-70 family RNA polymerase sigma factor [Luteimonas sp.]